MPTLSHSPTPDQYSPHEADLARLEAGIAAYDAAIAELRAEETDPAKWKRYWLDLLSDYDRFFRRLNDQEAR